MATMTLDQALRLGIEHHSAGRFAEAEAIYRQILSVVPNHADSLHLLGLLAAQAGHRQDGIDLIRRAISVAPDQPSYHSNLGNILTDLGQLDEAIACLGRAVQLKGDFVEAHYNLGNAWKAKGQLDQAITCYQRAVELKPAYAEAHNNLGNAFQARGRLDDAVASYRRAVELRPGYADAHNNLGNAWQAKGQLDEAIASHRRALAINPDFAEAHNNLGNALTAAGQFDGAIASYRRAAELRPGYADAHYNLGLALNAKGELDQAMACYRRALELKSDYPEAHNNLGNAWKDKGQLDQAIAAYRQALAIRPGYRAAHDNVLYTLPFHPASDLQSLFAACSGWNHEHAQPLKQCIAPHGNSREPDRRLRVGYVSPDFRNHPVGRFILPLLAAHDHERFEIFGYMLSAQTDALTEQLRSHADGWRSLFGISDDAAAAMIRQDGIDILVDLTMHMAGNRILVFARKPAPVQVTYLAYAGGTGVDAIDYRLTDRYLDPDESNDQFYLEKSFRLRGTYWCYQQSIQTPEVNPLPAATSGHITFGCLNNFCKVTPRVLEAWSQLLKRVADSRLLLYCPEGSHRESLRQFFVDRGIAAERLELLGRLPGEDYFKLYLRMDISLDPFPYTGGTTTCDALWMGVPVITRAGKTAVGRSGVSILTTLGHPEWIAQTAVQYVDIAADLAADLSRLRDLRRTLREQLQSSSLMDAARFAGDIEAAYLAMWQKYCVAASH